MSKFINPSYTSSLLTLLNPIFHTDSYKVSHKAMEVDGTQSIYSNLTPRNSYYFEKLYPEYDGKVVVFGLQYFLLKELIHSWNEGFFKRDHDEVMSEIEKLFLPYIGMDKSKLDHFSKLHKLQYLPLHIKSLDEGTLVPVGIPVMTMINTHPEFSWLTNYIESVLSAEIWKPITIATVAREFAKLRDKYYDLTVTDHTFKTYAMHDFSYRGHSTSDSAAICGAATLLYSSGTDNIVSLLLAKEIYGASDTTAHSVNASEHSVTTLGINHFATKAIEDEDLKKLALQLKEKLKELSIEEEYEQALGEMVTMHRLLTKVYPTGVLAYVSDSYDYWRVLTVILPILKGVIESRDGKLVIRPDSGDPVEMVVGESVSYKVLKDKDALNDFMVDAEDGQSFIYEVTGVNTSAPEWKGSIEVLMDTFGFTVNSKGYKELPPCIGLIYGDGITYQRASNIYSGLEKKGIAASTVVYGLGSFSLSSSVSRDSLGMAVKATAAVIDEQHVSLFKDPKTGDGSKKSAKGYLVINRDAKGELYLQDNVEFVQECTGLLRTVFINGELPYLQSFDEIKALANK